MYDHDGSNALYENIPTAVYVANTIEQRRNFCVRCRFGSLLIARFLACLAAATVAAAASFDSDSILWSCGELNPWPLGAIRRVAGC